MVGKMKTQIPNFYTHCTKATLVLHHNIYHSDSHYKCRAVIYAARHVISIILNLQFLSFYICYFVQSFPQNLVTIKAKHIYHKPNLNRQRDIICQYNCQTVCSAPYYSVSAVYLTPLRHMPPTTLPLNMSSLLQTICLSFICPPSSS